jgi:hypothetical protein
VPLSLQTLQTEVLKRTDRTRADFSGWPSTAAAAVASWAAAARAYFAEIVNPPLPPPGEDALRIAEDAFVASAGAETDGQGRLTAEALPVGFQAFGLALLAAPGYVVTSPIPAGGWSAQGAPLAWSWPDGWNIPTNDVNVFALLLSGLVDWWARTGTAGIPPVSAPWS